MSVCVWLGRGDFRDLLNRRDKVSFDFVHYTFLHRQNWPSEYFSVGFMIDFIFIVVSVNELVKLQVLHLMKDEEG